MGFLSPSTGATAPSAPSPPPSANAPTYANPQVQATGAAASKAAAGASGGTLPGTFGADGTIFTSPQGASAGPSATKQLTGQ
jgi:hypothetical protein